MSVIHDPEVKEPVMRTLTPNVRRAARAVAIALTAVSLGAVGYGTAIVVTPKPEPIIETVTVDVPPACLDALGAARDERAHTETARQHDALARVLSSERYDAELTLDNDKIADAAKALDAEKRLAGEAHLNAAEAAAAFDDAAIKCAPERDS